MVHIRKVFFAARRVFLWKVTYILHNIIIQINIGYKSAPKQYNLYTPRRRYMGKSIARGCKKSLVDQCNEDPVTRGLMMKKLEIVLKREMNVMCEVKTGSILRSGLWDHMKNFKWQSVIDEMKLHTPVLFGILNSCTLTKNQKSNRNATIGICTSILLKYRYKKLLCCFYIAIMGNRQVFNVCKLRRNKL